MRKPFTIIAAILVLIVAAAHVYRAAIGVDMEISGQHVPLMVSYIAAAVFAIVGLMTLVELRK